MFESAPVTINQLRKDILERGILLQERFVSYSALVSIAIQWILSHLVGICQLASLPLVMLNGICSTWQQSWINRHSMVVTEHTHPRYSTLSTMLGNW